MVWAGRLEAGPGVSAGRPLTRWLAGLGESNSWGPPSGAPQASLSLSVASARSRPAQRLRVTASLEAKVASCDSASDASRCHSHRVPGPHCKQSTWEGTRVLPSLGNTACHSSSCQQHAGSWAHRHRVRRRLGFPRAWHRAPFFTVQVHHRTLTHPHPCLPPMLSSTPDLISSVSCRGPQLSRPQTGLSFLSCVLQLGKRCTGPRVPPVTQAGPWGSIWTPPCSLPR